MENHYEAKNELYRIMGERTRRVKEAGKCQLVLFTDDEERENKKED
jgi:hypothetical protein